MSINDIIFSINDSILNGKSGTYNIGNGKSSTIKDLAELMITISGKRLEITYTDSLKGDIRNSQADISLAKKEIKYSPKFNLDKIKELLE